MYMQRNEQCLRRVFNFYSYEIPRCTRHFICSEKKAPFFLPFFLNTYTFAHFLLEFFHCFNSLYAGYVLSNSHAMHFIFILAYLKLFQRTEFFWPVEFCWSWKNLCDQIAWPCCFILFFFWHATLNLHI